MKVLDALGLSLTAKNRKRLKIKDTPRLSSSRVLLDQHVIDADLRQAPVDSVRFEH